MRAAGAALALSILFPAALFAADLHLRFARVTLAEGPVQVELPATGERVPAERNLPVGQGSWVETVAGGRAELALDEGSLIRLASDSLAELSDLTRLSTAQRITLISVERGTFYATAEPAGLDAFVVVAPGMEITFLAGSRIRVDVTKETSTVAVMEGSVRFSSRAAELDLQEGQTVRVNPQALDQFQLFREVVAGDLDRWSEQRDKETIPWTASPPLAGFPAGLGELEAYGKWMQTTGLGARPVPAWQPHVPQGWKPFQLGRWRWQGGLGYTWISAELWGWLPYHYGRWVYRPPSGWLWVPQGAPDDAAGISFHAGDAYWLRSAGLVGWGPLAPGEQWRADARPSLYSPANTTFAPYTPGARVIEPSAAVRVPPDPLREGQFLAALPAPPQPVVTATRKRPTRVGTTRILPIAADQAYNPDAALGGGSSGTGAGGIQVVGAEPASPEPAAAAPAPLPTYYNYQAAPAPAAPPSADYAPGGTVYVPGVVVIEQVPGGQPRDGRDHNRDENRGGVRGGERHGARAPAAPAAPPKPGGQPAPPPKQQTATPSGTPEHGTRLRTPEAGEDAAHRR
ncbi:MAG TPA: FecR family protein [Bryobacterales bacterium]|nr:FecR family protein [Bryobacterales bacterium]